MLNRTNAPAFKELENFDPIQVQKEKLQNNVPVYLLHADTQALLRIEFIFKAGNWYNPFTGVASTTAAMMTQGTEQFSSFQIAEMVSKYGAHLNFISTADHFKMTLFTLTKYLHEVLPIVQDILLNASFPTNEIAIFKEKMWQGLRLNLEKNSYVSSQLFKKTLFGEEHPYVENTSEKSIDSLNSAILRQFAQQHIVGKYFDIVVAGNLPTNLMSTLNHFFGNFAAEKHQEEPIWEVQTNSNKTIYVEKEDALQTNIKIGRISISRKHEDCFDMVVLNQLVAGFFGARLMKNLREDKGYTYGIHSSFVHLQKSDFWMISTDVKKEFRADALSEIYKELAILQQEAISPKELQLVKNHLLGNFCASINTCFDLADRFKIMMYQDLDDDYYQRYIQYLRNLDAQKIQQVAQKYLNKEDFVEITVG